MGKVYIVIADTGEYSGHTMWHVSAHKTREEADKKRDLMNEWMRLFGCNNCSICLDKWTHREDVYNFIHRYLDKEFCCYYTGVEYGVIEVEVE